MSLRDFRTTDLPLLPALLTALLCVGAAIHQNPAILRPVLAAVPHLF